MQEIANGQNEIAQGRARRAGAHEAPRGRGHARKQSQQPAKFLLSAARNPDPRNGPPVESLRVERRGRAGRTSPDRRDASRSGDCARKREDRSNATPRKAKRSAARKRPLLFADPGIDTRSDLTPPRAEEYRHAETGGFPLERDARRDSIGRRVAGAGWERRARLRPAQSPRFRPSCPVDYDDFEWENVRADSGESGRECGRLVDNRNDDRNGRWPCLITR